MIAFAPPRLLETSVHEGTLAPQWLGDHDLGFLAELGTALGEIAGLPSGVADDTVRQRVHSIAKRWEVPHRLVAFAAWVERRRFGLEVDAAVPPERARDVLFEIAATTRREDALALASTSLGVSIAEVERALFADRASRKIVVPPLLPTTPEAWVDRANAVMLGTFLTRATEVTARFERGHDAASVPGLARLAKRFGLLAVVTEDAGITTLALSGPLALFHDTTKYGRALAAFVPHVAAARPSYLAARVVMPEGASLLVLDADAPSRTGDVVAPPLEAQRDAVILGRRLAPFGFRARAFEGTVNANGRRLYPDFVVDDGEGPVFVEIVSFWTAPFLERLLRDARAAEVPVVLCVNETRAPAAPIALDDVEGVVPFRRTIDASRLASACASQRRAASRGRREEPDPKAPPGAEAQGASAPPADPSRAPPLR